MKKLPVLFLPVACAILLLAAAIPKIPPMPAAVSNNAVAALKNGLEVYSLMGIGSKRTWDDVTNKVYVLHLASGKWSEGRAVPGVGGRVGSLRNRNTEPNFSLSADTWWTTRGRKSPFPTSTPTCPRIIAGIAVKTYRSRVDSAVIGVDHDRYIYLVGGKSRNGPVNNVQVYDAQKNTWTQATPFPGTPVFGHAGGVVDGVIVFVDGAKKNTAGGAPYVTSNECWLGRIDRKDPNKIEWSKLPAHPGPGRFGIVAGSEKNHKIVFSGGTTAPHNFKGLGYDGKPPEVSQVTFAYDVHGSRWEMLDDETSDARADSGGILNTPVGSVIIGGIDKDLTVTDRVLLFQKR